MSCPRVLVISSCSDRKTQPSGELRERARRIKRELASVEKRLLRAPKQGDTDSALDLLAKSERLRSELGSFMLLQEDFGSKEFRQREERFMAYRTTAAEMYDGDHHKELIRGIELLRRTFGRGCIDLKIISAGYGLLSEDDMIVPYDASFVWLDGNAIDERAVRLGIHAATEEAIKGYDLVIFLLGQEYLRSLRLPVAYERGRQRFVFVVSASAMEFLDYDDDYGIVMVGSQEAREFGSAVVSLKGKLFHLLAKTVSGTGWHLMERLREAPELMMDYLSPYRKRIGHAGTESVSQLTTFDETVIPRAGNQNFRMSYYMPENEDRVDPNFDPWTLAAEPRASGLSHFTDQYAHEILNGPPWDGFLISLHEISRWSTARREEIFRVGAREYLRYPKNLGLIMGDCGAFTFDEHGKPPFTSREVLNQYKALGVDLGVSVDYIIFPELWQQDAQEAERRFSCNIQSAEEFWRTWNAMRQPGWRFVPVGVAQGGTPERLREAVQRIQDIGYRHVAIGGLARSPASVIELCLRAVAPVIRPDTQVHLFGFGKLEHARHYRELGITSFDSTSSLRQAFTRSVYWDPTEPGKHYTAIRVPYSAGRTAKALAQGGALSQDYATSRRLEEDALSALRRFDETGAPDDFVAARNALIAYDRYLRPWPYSPHMRESLRTLKERPWKRCDCQICREWGIAVAILRSNNHNRRRGFHNTWVFYRSKIERVGPGMTQIVDADDLV